MTYDPETKECVTEYSALLYGIIKFCYYYQ